MSIQISECFRKCDGFEEELTGQVILIPGLYLPMPIDFKNPIHATSVVG